MISEQSYALCMAIEELPASEMQTQISVMAAELRAKVAGVEAENVRLRPRAEIAGSLLTRTSKAEKRCRELEEELTLCLKEAPVGILAAICDMNKILGLEMPKTSYTEIPPAIQAVVDRVRELEAFKARVMEWAWGRCCTCSGMTEDKYGQRNLYTERCYGCSEYTGGEDGEPNLWEPAWEAGE